MSKKSSTAKPEEPQTGIEKAIDKAEGQTKLAALIGASQQMVAYWKKAGIVSDAGMCAAIERVTGIRCEELNPKEDWATLRNVLCSPTRKPAPESGEVKKIPGGGISKKLKEQREATL